MPAEPTILLLRGPEFAGTASPPRAFDPVVAPPLHTVPIAGQEVCHDNWNPFSSLHTFTHDWGLDAWT